MALAARRSPESAPGSDRAVAEDLAAEAAGLADRADLLVDHGDPHDDARDPVSAEVDALLVVLGLELLAAPLHGKLLGLEALLHTEELGKAEVVHALRILAHETVAPGSDGEVP